MVFNSTSNSYFPIGPPKSAGSRTHRIDFVKLPSALCVQNVFNSSFCFTRWFGAKQFVELILFRPFKTQRIVELFIIVIIIILFIIN